MLDQLLAQPEFVAVTDQIGGHDEPVLLRNTWKGWVVGSPPRRVRQLTPKTDGTSREECTVRMRSVPEYVVGGGGSIFTLRGVTYNYLPL